MPLRPAARQFALRLVKRLHDAGYEALWAGGCVRDELLGRQPSDYDVATNATPERIREVFTRRRTIAIGASFGVITVIGNESEGTVEIATFRSDAGYSDGRHPDRVEFTTAEADAQRRDFTINGLFFDPLGEQIIDYVDGLADIKRRVVRAIGDPAARIAEDKLRMLRGIRFTSTLEFQLDSVTRRAITRDAASITAVSAERISAELRRMLGHPSRAIAARLLRETGLLDAILPEWKDVPMTAVLSDPAELGNEDRVETESTDGQGPGVGGSSLAAEDAWAEAMDVLERLETADFSVAAAGWMRGLLRTGGADLKGIEGICRRWKLANVERKGIQRLLAGLPIVLAAGPATWPQVQRVLISPDVHSLLQLADAAAGGRESAQASIAFCRRQLRLPPAQLNPPMLVSGHDLRSAGLTPGPGFRELLEEVRDAQLAGRIGTRREALALARRLSKRPS